MISGIAGCLLIIINIAFLTLALGITAVGALLEWGKDFIAAILLPSLAASSAGASATGSDQALTLSTINDLVGQYLSILASSGMIILIIGAVMGCIAISGLCGVCCKSKILLLVYVISLSVIFLGIGIVLLVFVLKRSELESFVANQLLLNMAIQFTGINNANGITGLINVVQARLECCGVQNSSDFLTATNWNRTYEIDYGSGTTTIVTLAAPVTCCKLEPYTFTPINVNCTFSPTTSNSNYQTGCFTKLWNIIATFALYAVYGMSGLCGILLVLIIIGAILVRSYSKESVTPI